MLPLIGIVHKNAVKKLQNTFKPDNKEYLSIPPSFIAFFVGMVDGDGYIQITKTSKGFIAMKLVISLQIVDVSTLEYIHSVLKVGKINIYRDNRNPSCKLVINRTDLQQIVFPLLLYHNIFFLTDTRKEQFDLAIYILEQNIKNFDKIGNRKDLPSVSRLPNTPLDYTNLLFFKN